MDVPTLGSRRDGSLLNEVGCAAFSAGVQAEGCDKSGTQMCSSCRLVKYCSVACQGKHWSTHKRDCRSPFRKPDWRPSWTRPDGPPGIFILDGDLNGDPSHASWSPYCAYDCINAAHNEGPQAAETDFTLCFAAEGGLINMVATVNALPSGYSAQFQAIVNNERPSASARDAVILHCLLHPSFAPEEAAELCTHLMYSTALTPAQAKELRDRHIFLSNGVNDRSPSQDFFGGRLRVWHTALKPLDEVMKSTYTQEQAQKAMYDALHYDGRMQYVEKNIWPLRPPHRMAEIKLRATGVLLPFGESNEHFTEPNRLLFSEDGRWVNTRGLRPYSSWDMREAMASAATHGCHDEDLAGCLFFYVKAQLAEFARRTRAWRVRVFLTHFDDGFKLGCGLARGDPELAPFRHGCFDRVDLSPDVVDNVEAEHRELVLRTFCALLSHTNPHATLLMRTARWFVRRPGARAAPGLGAGDPPSGRHAELEGYLRKLAGYLDFDIDDPERQGEKQMLIQVMMMDAWHDNQPAFEGYLRECKVQEILERYKFRLKSQNTVTPSRLDWPLSGRPKALPGLSKEDWYLLACVGQHTFLDRIFEIGRKK